VKGIKKSNIILSIIGLGIFIILKLIVLPYQQHGVDNTVENNPDSLKYENDLVYKDYSGAAIIVENPCTIKLKNVQYDLAENKIRSVILSNDKGELIKEFTEDTAKIGHRINENGVYYLYALTESEEIINLSKFVSIEYVLENNSGTEKNRIGKNFINLVTER